MTVKEALSTLKSLANETMVARNVKNGAGKNQFGVKLGDIRAVTTGGRPTFLNVISLRRAKLWL